ALSGRYGAGVGRLVGYRRVVLCVFVVLLAGTWLLFRIVPTGFIPAQDKQYLIGIVQLPDAASLDRTEAVVRRMSEIGAHTPGVAHMLGFPGLSANGFVALDNAATVFIPLTGFDERHGKELSAAGIAGRLSAEFSA